MEKDILIRTKNLSKYYAVGDETIKALDDVNLEIERGQIVAILGTSGSGKSTLLNMALCLTAVCLICSAVLGGVYGLTKAPIDAAAQKALTESISAVLPEGGELSQSNASELEGVDEYYVLSENGSPKAYARFLPTVRLRASVPSAQKRILTSVPSSRTSTAIWQ